MGKRIVGRKRSIIIDTTGLMLTVLVTAASIQDSVAGERLLNRSAADHPSLRRGWAAAATASTRSTTPPTSGVDLEVVPRAPGTKGFKVLPRRWEPNAPWAGSCTTAAWPATTKPSPPAPPP